MNQEKKHTNNRREKTIGMLYVLSFFLLASFVCCWRLSYYADHKSSARKEFVISKMDRIRVFQEVQREQLVIVDSIYKKIKGFNPGINASYEESDIKFYLNDVKSIYEENSYDARYRIFNQVANFYKIWFADKKELWSKQQNINKFKKNLEDCQIGLLKKTEELKNTNK